MIGAEIKDGATPALNGAAQALPTAMAKAVFSAAQYATGVLRRVIYSTFKGRTGGLARSFREAFVGNKNGIATAGTFSDLVYADIQDRGGVIKPKTGSSLAIPLPNAGIPLGMWPRQFPRGSLFAFRSKAGNVILAERTGKNSLKPMYVLKPQVTIKGKGYIAIAADKAAEGIADIVGKQVDIAITRGVAP